MAEYRIVTDNYAGFEVQVRHWFLPIWHQPKINTSATKEDAKSWAIEYARNNREPRFIERLGTLEEYK